MKSHRNYREPRPVAGGVSACPPSKPEYRRSQPRSGYNPVPPRPGAKLKTKSRVVDYDSIEFWNEFQAFIEKTLQDLAPHLSSYILHNGNVALVELLKEASIIEWMKAFTHSSIDIKGNYELYETLGDKVWNTSLTDFLFDRFQDQLSSKTLTQLIAKYGAKPYQASLSRRLGFEKFIIVAGDIQTIHILEDVLESFIGVLFKLCQNLDPYLGYFTCRQVANNLLQHETITLEDLIDEISYIKEAFEGLKWGTITKESRKEADDTFTCRLTLPTKALIYLRGTGKNIPTLLSTGVGQSRESAERQAHRTAIQNLDDLGLTKEWFKNEKETNFAFYKDPRYTQVLQKDVDRRKELDGYQYFNFFVIRDKIKTPNIIINFQAETKSGETVRIASLDVPIEMYKTGAHQFEILRQYADGRYAE